MKTLDQSYVLFKNDEGNLYFVAPDEQVTIDDVERHEGKARLLDFTIFGDGVDPIGQNSFELVFKQLYFNYGHEAVVEAIKTIRTVQPMAYARAYNALSEFLYKMKRSLQFIEDEAEKIDYDGF